MIFCTSEEVNTLRLLISDNSENIIGKNIESKEVGASIVGCKAQTTFSTLRLK
jgi:hypothetical protein